MRHFLLVLLAATCCRTADAYELDYGLDDYFLVEALDSSSRVTETQIWDLTIRRGLVEGKERFVDFSLVVVRLALDQSGAHSLRDVEVYEGDPSSRDIRFISGAVTAEFGIASKFFVKVQFNQDGSLADLSGSRVNAMEPAATTTYRLVRKPVKAQVLLLNKFPSKEYSYSPRR